MFVAFLLLWIIFNGRITIEILVIGTILSAALFAFCCRFLGYSMRQYIRMFRLLPLVFRYLLVLLTEIVKANGQVLFFILSPRYEAEPQLIHFTSGLRTEFARVILANSITLTPGTITVSLEGNDFYVHCLDKEFAEGIDSSAFVELLQKMEAVQEYV